MHKCKVFLRETIDSELSSYGIFMFKNFYYNNIV